MSKKSCPILYRESLYKMATNSRTYSIFSILHPNLALGKKMKKGVGTGNNHELFSKYYANLVPSKIISQISKLYI